MGSCSSVSKSRTASATGNRDISTSQKTRDIIFQNAMNSSISGIRKKAEEGTGNYAWKNYNAVTIEQAAQMTQTQIIERTVDGVQYSVVTGIRNDKESFVAARSDDKRMKNYVDNLKKSKQEKSEKAARQAEEDKRKVAGSDKPTTTTYENWLKRKRRETEEKFLRSQKNKK